MRTTRVYVDQVLEPGSTCRLPEEAAHHVATVLRMKTGEALVLFNGNGGSYRAMISSMQKRDVAVTVGAHDTDDRESPLSITLAQAVMRGQHMDYALQKAVELGVQNIVPLLCLHGNVKLDDEQKQHRHEHWRRIVISACEQCGRNRIPQIFLPLRLTDWAGTDTNELKFMLHPRDGMRLSEIQPLCKTLTLLAGPEGGFSDEEIASAQRHGFKSITLGPRILRAESAALVAISICQARWGDV